MDSFACRDTVGFVKVWSERKPMAEVEGARNVLYEGLGGGMVRLVTQKSAPHHLGAVIFLFRV